MNLFQNRFSQLTLHKSSQTRRVSFKTSFMAEAPPAPNGLFDRAKAWFTSRKAVVPNPAPIPFPEPKPKALWNYTTIAENFLSTLPNRFLEEHKPDGNYIEPRIFEQRHVIGRDRLINGGVYLTWGFGEAIVVDSNKYPSLEQRYQYFAAELERKATSSHSHINQFALNAAYDEARKALRYDKTGVDRVNKQLDIPHLTTNPQKVSLTVYLENGVGVCRHQALYAAFLLERLIEDGHLRGRVSIDRNWEEATGSGHAWVRYTSSAGEVAIIDPALEFRGRLSDVKPDIHWFYKRPEDL